MNRGFVRRPGPSIIVTMSENEQPAPSGGENAEAIVLHMGEVTIEQKPESTRHEFVTSAVGFTDVTITGLWHLSTREIEKFEDGKGTDEVSKHGPGTYVGAGRLGGTQIAALKMGEYHRYDMKFHGNVLMVPFVEYDDTAWELEEIVARDGSELQDGAPGRMINRALQEHEINGVRYDAFILYAEPQAGQQGLAEGVIFRPEACLEVVGHEKSQV